MGLPVGLPERPLQTVLHKIVRVRAVAHERIMDFRFTEDQLTFRDAVRDFLDGECTPTAVRALLDSPDGGALKFRSALAELGLAGLPIAAVRPVRIICRLIAPLAS